MTDTLETLRRLAPEAMALADLPYDVQLIDNTINEADRVQREMIAAIDPVLEMLAEALAALEPLARMATGAHLYSLALDDVYRAAEVLEKAQ